MPPDYMKPPALMQDSLPLRKLRKVFLPVNAPEPGYGRVIVGRLLDQGLT